MRVNGTRIQTTHNPTTSSNTLSEESIQKIEEYLVEYGPGRPTRSELVPLSPYSFKNFVLELEGFIDSSLPGILKRAGSNRVIEIAEQLEIRDLTVPSALRPLARTAKTERQFRLLRAAKILAEESVSLRPMITEPTRLAEKRFLEKLGHRQAVLLDPESLLEAIEEGRTPPSETNTLFESRSDLWTKACLDFRPDLSVPWERDIAHALCEHIADSENMLACPAPREVAIPELARLTGRPESEIRTLLEEREALRRIVFGEDPAASSRKKAALGGPPVVTYEKAFDGFRRLTEVDPSYTSVAPPVYALRRSQALNGAKAGHEYHAARALARQCGRGASFIAGLYAKTVGLAHKPSMSRYEIATQAALEAIFERTPVTFNRDLPGDKTRKRWDFRIEDPSPLLAVASLIVEVHGEDHFMEIARGSDSRTLGDCRSADDFKTKYALEWLDENGGGTYLVIHHDVVGEGAEWLSRILRSPVVSQDPPRWVYARPLGSTDWPGNIKPWSGRPNDGLPPRSERERQTLGDIELVWVR